MAWGKDKCCTTSSIYNVTYPPSLFSKLESVVTSCFAAEKNLVQDNSVANMVYIFSAIAFLLPLLLRRMHLVATFSASKQYTYSFGNTSDQPGFQHTFKVTAITIIFIGIWLILATSNRQELLQRVHYPCCHLYCHCHVSFPSRILPNTLLSSEM